LAVSIFEAFKFKHKKTLIHALDPRTKLYIALVLSILSLIFVELIPLLILFLIVVPLIVIAKSLREWLRTLKGLTILILFIGVINAIFNSVNFALAMIIRLITLMSAFSIFFLTVHPDDLSQALIQMRFPFSFAFAMSMAIRYVPTIAKEAQTIREAQMSRGLEFEKGSFIQRIKNFIPIIIPLIITSIRRAIEIAESLESRGFGATKKRTYLYVLKLSIKDYIALALFTSILIVAVYFKFIVGLPWWAYWSLPL